MPVECRREKPGIILHFDQGNDGPVWWLTAGRMTIWSYTEAKEQLTPEEARMLVGMATWAPTHMTAISLDAFKSAYPRLRQEANASDVFVIPPTRVVEHH